MSKSAASLADALKRLRLETAARKKAQKKLAKREDTLNSIHLCAPGGIGLIDQDHNLHWPNRHLSQITEYTIEQLEMMPEEMFYETREEFERVRQLRGRELGKSGYSSIETRWKSQHGKMVDILLNTAVIKKDDPGKGIIAMVLDITGDKESQLEILREKQKAERYLNLAGVMFIGLDAQGRINLANAQACKILECSQQDILGLDWFDHFIPPGQRESVRTVFRQLISKEIQGAETYENSVVSLSGQEKIIAWHNTFIADDDGQVVGLLGAGEDVTEKRALEARLLQSQKMESIGMLAGGIAHDFNNILYPIIGFTQLSMDELGHDHPVQENLEDILSGAKRARDLVKQILLFSRQQDQELRPTQLIPVIKATLKLLASGLPSQIHIQEEFSVKNDLVLCDPTQIHEILMNLFVNACHAFETEEGTITVTLHDCTPDRDRPVPPGTYVCLSVEDNGSGIPEEMLGKVFEPYYTTKEVGKGSGLGLSVVHGIVKHHNGEIRIRSHLGQGTVVEIFLPLLAEADGTVQDDGLPERCGTERIIFVDDEKAVVKLGTRVLEGLGYQVVGMGSSTAALKQIRNDPKGYDLLITDMAMPDMDGIDLAKAVYALNPDMPVMICSGYSKKLDQVQSRPGNIFKVIDKPLSVEDLSSKVRSVLNTASRRNDG